MLKCKFHNFIKNLTSDEGGLVQQSVYDLMCGSDVLLLSSIEEGIANVCVEAMLCKLPVLATDCGGMKELVSDGKTGFITPIRKSEEMARKLVEISLMSCKELMSMTDRAYAFASKQHALDKMVNDMEKLYNKVSKRDEP